MYLYVQSQSLATSKLTSSLREWRTVTGNIRSKTRQVILSQFVSPHFISSCPTLAHLQVQRRAGACVKKRQAATSYSPREMMTGNLLLESYTSQALCEIIKGVFRKVLCCRLKVLSFEWREMPRIDNGWRCAVRRYVMITFCTIDWGWRVGGVTTWKWAGRSDTANQATGSGPAMLHRSQETVHSSQKQKHGSNVFCFVPNSFTRRLKQGSLSMIVICSFTCGDRSYRNIWAA